MSDVSREAYEELEANNLELAKLLRNATYELDALYGMGVDNWAGYDEAMELYEKLINE